MSEPSIILGTTQPNEALNGTAPTLIIDNPRLKRHKDRDWFLDHLYDRFSIDAAPREVEAGERSVPLSLLAKHGIIIGSSGSGKSHLALHLLREQLKAGCSAVVIDVKTKTLERALDFALEAGLQPQQISVILPSCKTHGVPAWNPFAGEAEEVRERVTQFRDIIRLGSESWGIRMDNLLESAATIMTSLDLSLLEMYEFLLDEEYRTALLIEVKTTPIWEEFRLRYEYFEREYPAIAKTESVQAVLSRIRHLVDNQYLRALFCASGDSLDLATLWQKPRLILVHMDSSAIGDEGVRFLAGMLTESLLRTAMKHSGPVPVLLFLDEMGFQGPYLSRSLTKILAIAREQNLRLLLAAQHLGQLSDEMQEAALTSTAFRAFFRLGDKDADYVAKRIGNELTDEVRKVELVADKAETEKIPFAQWFYADCGKVGSADIPYYALMHYQLRTHRFVPNALFNIWGYLRLLKEVGFTLDIEALPELAESLHGLRNEDIEVTSSGYSIVFPKFKVHVLDRANRTERIHAVTRALSSLPPRHAIIKGDRDRMELIQVANVRFSLALPSMEEFLGTGQSANEISTTYTRRFEAIEALKTRHPIPATSDVRPAKASKVVVPKLDPMPVPKLKLNLAAQTPVLAGTTETEEKSE